MSSTNFSQRLDYYNTQDPTETTSSSTNKVLTGIDDNRIICGVCGRFYCLPRILPCLHTFCSECILGLQRYPIISEISLSHDIEKSTDWLSIYENYFDDFRNKSEIVIPPVQFQSPDLQRRTLPRSRRKGKHGTPKSRSFSENMNGCTVDFVLGSSESLDTADDISGCGGRGVVGCGSREDSRGSINELLSTPSTVSDIAQAATLPRTAGKDQKWLIMCPQCWTEVQVSTTLDELPRNLVAERCASVAACLRLGCSLICDHCSEASNNIEEVHADKPNFAISKCLDCVANLCLSCQDAHARQTKAKFHKLINVQQATHSGTDIVTNNTGPGICRVDLIPAVKRLFPDGPQSTNIPNSPKLPSLFKFQRQLWEDSTAAASPISSAAAKCLSHPDKKLDMFCVTCEQNACMDCVVLTHSGHDCQFVTKQLFRNQMKDVDRLIQTALPQVKDVDDQLKCLAQVKVAATELSNKVKDEVNTFMDTFVQAVETHRDTLLAQVRSLAEEQERALSLAEWRLQQTRADVQQTCSFLGDLLTSASDIEILSLKKLLTRRLLSVTEASPGTQPQQDRGLRFCPAAEGDIINGFQMFGRVISNQPSHKDSFLHGEGLNSAHVKGRVATIVTVLDNDGIPYTESDVTVEARIAYQGQEINVPVTYKHLDGSDHLVEFVPVNQGIHLLHVLVNGSSIKGSPFTFVVKPRGRRHFGVWLNSSSRDGRREDARAPGGHSSTLPGHCAGYFWSCCGTMTYSSDCPAHSARSSPVRQATV